MASDSTKERDTIAWNIFQALDLLCKNNGTCSAELRSFLPKQIWNSQDRETVVNKLSKLFLNVNCVVEVGSYFRPLVLDIAARTKKMVLSDGHSNVRLQRKFAVALGLVLPLCPELERFTGEFINVFKPFSCDNESEEPKKKKSKKEKIAGRDWCIAVHNLATRLTDPGSKLSVRMVSDYLSDQDPTIRWHAAQTYCHLTGMTEHKRSEFLRLHFTAQEQQDCVHGCYQDMIQTELLISTALGAVTLESLESAQTHTRHQLLPSDLDSDIVSITGVLLPRLTVDGSTAPEVVKHQWVGVSSMSDSLRSLALAVSAGKPVLVQGPVGCGKTLLVQHLAALTGRQAAPHLIKVQLGDQTDSKALLGTYQCTEVPGQFVWRPGVLTEAVTKGHWVLLEDLDHAPMEVVSTLAPLLHTSTLSLPGHGDLIHAAPGFQLFATQRLFASGDGLHSQNRSSAVLDKLWTQVTIQPLSRTELKQVIVTRFPSLPPVVDRLLDIYFMLSAGRHHMTSDLSDMEVDEDCDDDAEENTVGKFLSLTGRLISTRDLMSWCGCVSDIFVPSSPTSAELILQAAIDCFVSCLPNPSRRLDLAKAIATHLSLTDTKAEYFLLRRMPHVEEEARQFTVGNIVLPCKQEHVVTALRKSKATFSFTRPSVCLLEKVAACVKRNEPVLLVGETGTGKTSSVQFLAQTLGHKLHVINLNQQSDSVDLLGGFKPVDLKFLMMPLRERFERLFCKTFSRKQNVEFLHHLQNCFTQKRWHDLLALMEHSCQGATTLLAKKQCNDIENESKWRKQSKNWQKVATRIKKLKTQVKETENVLAFSFMEGTLVKALKCGDWVLLDEINLAAAETLQCLAGLLESTDGSLVLTDRGNTEPVIRHADFRLFACMNPATDVGKKDLTPGVRNRFTELYVDELVEGEDLRMLVGDYLTSLSLTGSQLKGMVKFYTEIRQLAATHLVDGTGHKPHYSLRTLCRALRFIRSHNCGSVARSLYEGFCLSFLTQLDRSSHPVVTNLICQHVLGKTKKESILRQPLPQPTEGSFLKFCDYWISQGGLKPCTPDDYIITPSVKENLKDLARVVSAGSHPVLLQGETSVGKTSLITWLARSSGNHCLRVNNHEHTDLQEYVGCYAADETGKLVFKEGVLVEAMRKGFWIILDELNLAPTDVLEALNRLLDDNQELFIPETQEMVKAHPKFMLFATQNPPGHYGGRKMLSRAFRNRFVELHFDEIPKSELETILHRRCDIPLSYAKRLVAVMLELQVRRQQTGLFAGKQSWMTLRDLFRWADRYKSPGAGSPDTDKSAKFYNYDQHMADHGYMLLAGRVRKAEEDAVIREVIEKHFKKCKVDPDCLFSLSPLTSPTVRTVLQTVLGESSSSSCKLLSSSLSSVVSGFEHVVWTLGMRRLAVLIGQAIQFGEPILLVGDTGCGKTTVCQLYAAMKKKRLHAVNCHLHTESADFLGGLRPVRSHTQEEGQSHKLFEWVDGPLVSAMKQGAMFLIDEISLADDSVLERLNSVLEPERSILLAEKGGGEGVEGEVEVVKAAEGFQVFATMNPGGDFGKKELSPALRNRFTEIWCPQSNGRDDLMSIIEHNMSPGVCLNSRQDGVSGFGAAIMDFVAWFSNNEIGKRCTVSIRDILSWVRFVNTCTRDQGEGSGATRLEPAVAYMHGACLVFLDSLGSGTTSRGSDFDTQAARSTCLTFLQGQVKEVTGCDLSLEQLGLVDNRRGVGHEMKVELTDSTLSIFPFSLHRETGSGRGEGEKYAMQAPTTCVNAQRILRGLQLSRPLLLEGAPGVGKTSLVAAVARLAGRQLIRINLSEQTDVTDLFGADLPVEGETGGSFAWRDGPFLQALKAGHWVVFDEMNLASQSVLEGLNACLDHRGEVFVPELARTFHIQPHRTRIFACQNPLNQGGGRKGLPRSFLNRFTQVYVEPLSREDLIFICTTMYPDLPHTLLSNMVHFNMKMHEETMIRCAWGHRGAPWEFNLRDINRWCDLLLANQATGRLEPGEYVSLVYQDRMRTSADKLKVAELYRETFGQQACLYQPSKTLRVGPCHVQAGHAFLQRRMECVGREREEEGGTLVLHHSLAPLESLMTCVNMGWMAILVGSASSGKSSVVRLLAELSGHILHTLPMSSAMDTTELLGGFEQADVGRHVAELTEEVVEEVRLVQQRLSVRGDKGSVGVVASLDQQLLALWVQSQEDVEEDAAREKEALLSRIQQLQKLIAKLCRLESPTERLLQLSESLKQEQEALERSEAGCGGGGVFEWVDSLLVKALRAGHWLLIDNVNFCSPSVLDRLNALLEPRGVLTINERGVTTDGTVPTITPHPDFRLFLSMDPKYGEISRAMRNRGVEIYMLGEGDGCPYNDHDTLSMVHQTGLHSKLACDWLMALHSELREKLTANERPGLCDLLRCAMVAKQQQEKGIGMAVALRYAAQTVYVRNMKSLVARQLVCSILSEHLDKLKETAAASLTKVTDDWMDWALVAPSVQQFQCHSGLTSAQQAARVFTVLLTKHGVERFCPSVTPCVSDSYLHSLRTALSIFLAHQSSKDWSLACDWIKSMLAHKKTTALMDLCHTQEEKVFFEKELTQLLETGESFLQLLFKDDMVKDLVHAEGNLCGQDSLESSMLESTPWDHGSNMQVIRMAERRLLQACPQDAAHVTHTVTSLLSSVYRLELLLVMKLMTDPLKETIAELEDMSRQVMRRKSEQGTVLYHVCQLLTSVLHHLPHLINTLSDHNTHLLHHAQDRLLWLPRLLEESVRGRERGEVEEVYLSHLALHWSWCINKLLTHLVTPDSAPAVQSAITKIHSILGDDNSAAKIFVTFWSSWGHPGAYPTETLAKLWQELCRLSGSIAVDGSMSLEVAQQRVKALKMLGGRLVCRRLAFIANKLFSGDFDVQSDLNSVREELETHKLLYSENSSKASLKPPTTQLSESKEKASPPLAVQLWPAYEYLDLLAEFSLLMFSKERGETGNRVQLADFKMACSPAALCFVVNKEQEMKSGEEMRWLLHVLQRLWTSPAVNSCTRWLTWDDDSQSAHLPAQDINGPAVLHRSAILLYASHLLSSSNHNTALTSQYDLLPLNVTLSGINAQLSQLTDFTRYLWKHAPLLSSGHLSPGKMEEELLTQSFLSLLRALTPLINTDKQEEWSTIIATLSSGDLNNQSTLLRSWQENASGINAHLSQILNLFNQHCTLIKQGKDPVLGVLSHGFEALTGMLECQGGSAGVGRAMVYVGLSLLYLLAPKGPVDPVHKATVKLEHYRQELSGVEIDIEVWEAHLKLMTGENMADISPDILHPRLAFLIRRRADLVSAIADLEKRHAFRGDKTEYLRLSQEVETILETLASVTTVQGLTSKLHTSATCGKPEFGSRLSVTRAVLREEQTWQTAAGRFCKRLCAEYPYLPDLTVPVCVAVEQMRLGMRVLSQEVSLRVKQCQVQYWPGSGQLDKTVSHLCSFPSLPPTLPTWLHLASSLSSPATRDTLTCLLTCDQGPPVEQALSRLLSSSLQLVKIHAQQTGELTPDLCLTLTHILNLFVKAWQEQEDARRAKEEEEASLYHFKDKKHGDDKTEEEKDEAAFKLAFPSFRDDFADMIEASTLEEVGRKESPMDQEETAIPESISEQEMDDICTTHVHLVSQLTSTEWLSRQQSPWNVSSHGWDVLKPALHAYQVFAEIGKNSWELLSEQVDCQTLGSHLIVCGTLAHSLQTTGCDGDSSQSSALRPPSPACYNVYVDPNVEEVMQCGPVLCHLVARVKELMQEWPQHPILNQIVQLVERIESFPVMSPIVKFLTGMELLLEKAQHWERNAASHVSLATQLSEVTTLIVRWRKLELKCWSGALDIEVERCRRKASRWWFHLYTLTSTYLSDTQGDCELGKVLESLKQFVEGSSVGEFTARLDILLAFHCHLVHAPPSTHRDQLLPVLWNLHQFYNQFRPTVETEIARFRAPIEKELKGFVKIARWSEMNYWALKESTEKTHRTVHKHARTFQTLLNQPVRPHLGEKHSDLAADKPPSSSPSYSQHIETYHQHCLQSAQDQQQARSSAPGDEDAGHQSVSHLVPGCSLLGKVPSLCQRALKHWRSCLTASSLCQDIALLDDLTGELIEEASELQKLEVPQCMDKEKQKTEAKHIHLRKRAALADCFKQLSSLGLSFKKGLLKEKTNHVDNALHLSPFNPAASLEKGSRLETLWAGCDMYFTRCLSRLAQFSAALYSPSKDLGMDNIQRCQGFVEHLTEVFMAHRLQLTHTFSSFTLYRKLVSAVDRLKLGVSVTPQQDTRHWLDTIKKEVTQMNQGLTQFSLLLQACPTTSTSPDSPALSPFPPSALPLMAQLKHGDELWTKCWTSVQTYLQSASSMQTSLVSLTDIVLFTSEDVGTLSKTVAQLSAMGKGVQEMVQTLNSHVNNNCLTSSLTFLASSVHKLHQNFTQWTHNLETSHQTSPASAVNTQDVSCFASKVEHLVESVLLSVQKLVKCNKEEKKMAEKSSEGKEEGEEKEEEEEDVKECQLVSLAEQLDKHVSLLDSEKLTHSLQDVCRWLEEKTNTAHTDTGAERHSSEVWACVKLLSGSRPLLHVYCDVLETHVARSIALHRTLAKMLSVMLAVFTQLALKGFCLPVEYSDEAGGEGATDFKDIEGGGIGEGQGAKDVSDQIESEDQLDETKLPEEEKDKSEDQQPDIAPEDNAIEMTDDFDSKPQDMEPVEGDDNDDDNDEKEEEEAEKQMGEVDGPVSDKLDDQMWGSDEEEDIEDKNEREEDGPGSGEQEKMELMAKEELADGADNQDKKDDKQKKDEKDEDNNNDDTEVPDFQDFDESEYDDNQPDGNQGQEEREEPENLDLPEDLNLDHDEQDAEDNAGESPPDEGEEDGDLPEDAEEEIAGEEKEGREQEEKNEESKEGEEEDGMMEENKDTNVDENMENETAEDEKTEEKDGEKEDEKKTEGESAGQEREDEEEGVETKGLNAHEKDKETETEAEEREDSEKGKLSHDTEGGLQNEDAEDNAAGENDEDESEGQGQAASDQQEGHEGSSSSQFTEGSAPQDRKQSQRRPGQSKEDRSLGSAEEKFRRLKTTDQSQQRPQPDKPSTSEDQEADMYEHIRDETSHADAQTLDAATDTQQKQQAVVAQPEDEGDDQLDDDEDVNMMDDDDESEDRSNKMLRDGSKQQQEREKGEGGEEKEGGEGMEMDKVEIPGSVVETLSVERPPESTIHTHLQHLHLGATMNESDVESLRSQLESSMTTWTQADVSDHQAVAAAAEAWQKYETLTSSLSQELCEQLRLVLEPSQATKLKGDYRTGKRLNMRKVIPYIASQFRKDKIWLRRTKPSKRQYQIMIAIDDSSSMADNHSKQLAFESLALTANALTLLETGELGVCSFGKTVQLLHPFTETFSNQAGARILQQFTFEQTQTRVALMLEQVTGVMLEARSQQQGWLGRPETAQLLLIVSDGRGINAEGMSVVRQAVRKAREANIFVVFVILDDPKNKNSILDIRLTTFKDGMPVFHSYMEEFPFPFYVILRDINSLPQVLSDALRQWFELVTASAT